eukprot:RCo047025
MPGQYLPFVMLDQAVRSGQSTTRQTLGCDIWAHFRKAEASEGLLFSEVLKKSTARMAKALVDASGYDWSWVRTVVDVGGSKGAFLSSVLLKVPSAKGILLDLPEIVSEAPAYLQARGVADRVQCVGGDFLSSMPFGDCYLVKHILLNWSDEQCLRILQLIHDAMDPAGRVLVVEELVDNARLNVREQIQDISLLVLTDGGRLRTLAEHKALLGRAGFTLTSVLKSQSCILEATKAPP